MKRVECYPYLGELISDKGLSDSIIQTISKRYNKAYRAIFEINIIIQDVRCSIPGTFTTAMMIWEMSVLPALMNSASCWIKLPASALKKLNKLSQLFLSTLLQAGPKCPIPALFWYTGSLLPINKIIEEKVLLMRNILNLDSTCLAAEVLAVQRQLELADTLWSEVTEHLTELGLELNDLTSLSKVQFRSKLKAAITEKNRLDLLEQIKSYKKFDYWEIKDEPFEMKKYFKELTLQEARVKFAIDTKTLRGIKGHFLRSKK